uniref:Uncharacterized protein n=1 Tax=Arundo donax TaxID=35708 RepID=A0A0A9T2T8_ARUDO
MFLPCSFSTFNSLKHFLDKAFPQTYGVLFVICYSQWSRVLSSEPCWF